MTPQRNKRRETQPPSPKHNPNMQSSTSLAYPPGFRFVPTDAELIHYYLKPFSRDNNKPWPNLPIHHVNIYESNPQQLSEEYKQGNLTEWFFISERTKIKRNGKKQKRVDHNGGYWHGKAVAKTIKAKHGVVGYKTTLNYYVGKQPNGVRTNWLMQEYWLKSSDHDNTVDHALCKIYLSPTARKNKNEEDDEAFEEEVENQQPQPQFYPTPTPLVSHQPHHHDNAYQEAHQPHPLDHSQSRRQDIEYQEPLQAQPLNTINHHQPHRQDIEYQEPLQAQPLNTINHHQPHRHDIEYQETHQIQPQPVVPIDHHQPQRHEIEFQERHQPHPLDIIYHHQPHRHNIAYQEPHQVQPHVTIDHHHQPQRHDNEYQEPHQPQPLDIIHHHQPHRHNIAYQELHQVQPQVTIEPHQVQPHKLQFWQATHGSHQTQPHDLAYHEPQSLYTVQDHLPQFWPAPLDLHPPHYHDIQYPQPPQPLDAIEYQYLYQSGPLTTYGSMIESSTQDMSNGDSKKVDHALKNHLTPRGVKREADEEENEKRKKKKKEEGVEASKEEPRQPINSHQNSDDDDSFFVGFVDTHLLDIDIDAINSHSLKKSSDKD